MILLDLLFELGFKGLTKYYLTKLRKRLILWLAGNELPVILNCKVYDDVLKYNERERGDILKSNCRIESIEKHIQREAAINKMNADKGVSRHGNTFVLHPEIPGPRRVRY